MNMIPNPDPQVSLRALGAMLREQSVLAAIEVFAREVGNVFQMRLPGFRAVMLVGPEAARFVLVSGREDFRWRSEGDPVTALLRQGVLVQDGEAHDRLRRAMNPALHKRMLEAYIGGMVRGTDQVMRGWAEGQPVDMLVEMRRAALLILLETLFKVDFSPDMESLWKAILKTLDYISPGLWMFWRGIPRPQYQDALRQMDAYLYRIIAARRAQVGEASDLLGLLVSDVSMDDGLIRDQLLTMLIAGHDTSTALLSWALYLLGKHPETLARAQAEVDAVVGRDVPQMAHVNQLTYLDQVINETLRLYPPIHLGSRTAAVDLTFEGYSIPAGTRVMYSVYLTQRMPQYWPDAAQFKPERWEASQAQPQPYTYLPFGGGPRNCIGALYAQVEAKIVLASLLQRRELRLLPRRVYAHMGATLEPRPGVWMETRLRRV
jgi:cytochrome P450